MTGDPFSLFLRFLATVLLPSETHPLRPFQALRLFYLGIVYVSNSK